MWRFRLRDAAHHPRAAPGSHPRLLLDGADPAKRWRHAQSLRSSTEKTETGEQAEQDKEGQQPERPNTEDP